MELNGVAGRKLLKSLTGMGKKVVFLNRI